MTENPPKTTVLSGMFGRCVRRVATIGVLMGAIQLPATARDIVIPEPVPPSAAVRSNFDLSPFYRQWIDVEGMPVVASARVDPYAVKEAAWLIRKMIGHRQDLLRALAANGVRFAVMARNELTTRIPEHSDLIPGFYWDRRARGLGATEIRPATSCGEENLLNYPGDPYATENILIHDFSHAIHLMGLNTVDSSFESRLAKAYDEARRKGLWSDTYAITNKEEYWAEGVQSWFDTNREHDNEHNHVNTRVELNRYDPALATLLVEIFGDTEWAIRRQRSELTYCICRDSASVALINCTTGTLYARKVSFSSSVKSLYFFPLNLGAFDVNRTFPEAKSRIARKRCCPSTTSLTVVWSAA